MSDKRERFGRYLILDHLVDGGMAKICRARFLGEQADKIVAIKMVQPQYSKDEAFKTMFMDEIKLTFDLIHPNIVQTYDYGVHKHQLYVAMEYCDGKNLKEYLDKLKDKKLSFPIEACVYIIGQVCQGLHYAHNYTNKLTGKSGKIIHRDISPHNIMLTYDGSVKVIDFGIAKADSNSEATQAGTIKGKLSYLAPEYLEGEELDPSYDQFAVGITLWEMLCRRKLFKASNDLAVLKKIQECKIPSPSTFNPNVTEELEKIVLKALSKDRKKRYENLDQMNKALMKFLYTNYPSFSGTDLSYLAKTIFKEEIKKDREKLFEYGKIDIAPYLKDLKDEMNGGKAEATNPDVETVIEKKEEAIFDFGFEEEDKGDAVKKARQSMSKTRQTTIGKKKPDIKEVAKNGTEKLSLDDQAPISAQAKTRSQRLGKRKTSTSIKLNKGAQDRSMTRKSRVTKVSKTKTIDKNKKSILVAGIALVFIGIFQFKDLIIPETQIVVSKEKSISEEVTPKASIQITNFNQQNQSLFINGERVRPGVLGDVEVDANQEFVMRVQTPGREHFVDYIKLNPGENRRIEIPPLARASYGYITMSRNCLQGQLHFELFGEKRQESLPLQTGQGIALPVRYDESGRAIASTYRVYFIREGENIERPLEVSIDRPDDSFDLCSEL